ncbi:MAG TPA: carboxypeptidase regulatory-like domain-containing protein [Polyangia bacterium]|nr:carboxypeptidase regulatory-like domain-containing protein [Polyangia bacterium]
MNRTGLAATAAWMAFALLAAGPAVAQEVTGGVIGRVVDKDTGAPLGGVTVMVSGPQGEDASITDDQGNYSFTSLKVGKYTIRFYIGNNAPPTEQPDVAVLAEKTVRVNARIAGAAAQAPQETYVIKARAPVVDIGSARVGATFDEDLNRNLPVPLTAGELIEKAPGAFVDPTGNVSIGGATGLENIYMVNGLNVTGMELGNIDNGASSLSGGTNLPLEFLTQVDVNSGGYQAEFGGAMGGVVNMVLKSGTNEWHGSVFGYDAPYWLSASPKLIPPTNGNVLGSQRRLDFDSQLGFEVGGPLIKNKLFFWAGFAPRIIDTHVYRELFPITDANGTIGPELQKDRLRLDETHRTYSYATTLDFAPAADHHLTLSLWGTPSYNREMRVFSHAEATSDPSWAMEQQDKVNTDFIIRWTSKLLDKRWLIEVNLGLHRESYSVKSPNDALNGLNQLEYWGSNLYDLEGIPECKNTNGFEPCPVATYRRGGFGTVKSFTGDRSLAEIKSTHIFSTGGHGELKYGWRLEASDFDQDRYYSGPLGARGLVQLAPNGGPPYGAPYPYINHWIFFTVPAGDSAALYGTANKPFTNLLQSPSYQDHLRADVGSLINAPFIEGTFTPAALPNLTMNLGARVDMQRMTDYHGNAFMDTGTWDDFIHGRNISPRASIIFDPMNDGRSKISVSYGQYFEAIPMNLAARYFGGEGILVRNGVPSTLCTPSDLYSWTGNGEWRSCAIPPAGAADAPNVSTSPFNSGTTIQSHLQGQYHQEVVATLERELMENLSLRLDYQHRWLGNIIEDGTADPSGSFGFTVANPGNVPDSAISDAKNEVAKSQADLDAAMKTDQNVPANAARTAVDSANLATAQQKLANLQGLQKAPKPERTYDALTLTVNKRFSQQRLSDFVAQQWRARASYTYSRLVGNYEGLYQAEGDYFAPNGSNAYDTPDLYLNQRGRLPNDHPHQGRIDGYYTLTLDPDGWVHNITAGLGFVARSGMPRSYVSSWYFGQPQNMLLPRGSAGRTPTLTRFDLHLAYGQKLSKMTRVDVFADIFNVFNQQTTILTDDVYTYDLAPAIVNGTPSDLKFAKNFLGQPITRNPNFGQPLAYQAPRSVRLGLRLSF